MMLVITPFFTLLPIIISSYSNEYFQVYPAKYVFFTEKEGISLLIHFFFNIRVYFRFPFDWETFTGYLGCNLIQVPTILVSTNLFVIVLILNLGFCLIVTEFVSDIEISLRQLNEHLNGPKSKEITNQIIIKNKLNDIIIFHSESMELCYSK